MPPTQGINRLDDETMNENAQATFTGWALLELMGHQREIGYVTTEYFGGAALFRVDVPELPEREFTLTAPESVGGEWMPAGSKVKRPATPARSRLVAPGALYAMNPCTEEAARTALERSTSRPLILVEAAPKALGQAVSLDDDDDDDAYGDGERSEDETW
jgi:hypothetical protein